MTTLTISIPTFNRANLIGETLNSILGQISDEMRPRIEILISDNASTDKTPEVIENYRQRHPEIISYYRNQENVGFSPNVNLSVQRARNEFSLIMSDDDCLEDNALADILQALDMHPDVGLLLTQYRTWDRTLSTVLDTPPTGPDRYYPNGIIYFTEKKGAFTPALISGFVFRKCCWTEAQPELYTDINSIHFILGPLVLAKHACLDLRSRPLIKYRADMGHWSIETDPTYPFPMFVSYLKGCRAVKSIFPAKTYQLLYCTTIRTTIGHAIRNKVLGLPFPKSRILEMLTPYFDTTSIRTRLYTSIFLLVSTLPRWTLYVPFRWLVPKKL